MGAFLGVEDLKKAERGELDVVVDLVHWQDAAAAEDIGTVPSGYKYVITEITIQNLGAASVLGFYNEAAASQAEANHKISIDAKATDTTVVTGILVVFTTAVSVIASVCAVAHNLKIHLGGYRVPA